MRFIPFGRDLRPAATLSLSQPAGLVPALALLVVSMLAAACTSAADDTLVAADDPTAAAAADGVEPDRADADMSAADGDRAGPEQGSSLAELVTELPAAPVGFPPPGAATQGPRPTAVTIEALGVRQAPIIDVGVEPNGDMEVPPVDQVGWYRYGPTPGAEGSAILAAHIAYDGVDGVFVRLVDLDPGDEIEVTLDDGTRASYVVESTARYPKDALPEELVFARSGPPRLVLVTCGGRFDVEARSYDDNVVAMAIPVPTTKRSDE